MATQKTALHQLIEMIETRIKSIPATECGTYEHGQYEASSSIIDWVKSELLPVEREQLIEAYENGLIQSSNFDNDHEDDCECSECVLNSEEKAKEWFNETYTDHESE